MSIRVLIAIALFATAPLAAMADQQDDQNACMQDAQTVCGQFIPDRERVAHCLMANSHKVTPACRAALKHFK